MSKFLRIFSILTLILVIGGVGVLSVGAQDINELEAEIAAREARRQELVAEAARITEDLTKVGAEKGVLQAELSRINAERKSLDNTIKQTENQIGSLRLKIQRGEKQISEYSSDIRTYADAIAALLRGIDQRDRVPPSVHVAHPAQTLQGVAVGDDE